MTRFNICDTSMCFVNSHLSSGKEAISGRLSDIKKIFKDGFQKDRLDRIKDTLVEESDQVYFFGNLNFRLSMPDSNARIILEEYFSKIEQGKKQEGQNFLNQLIKTDQLMNLQTNKTPLFGFVEGRINFPPTYKLNEKKGTYLTGTEHTPAWTDRILFKNQDNSKVRCLAYTALTDIKYSAHL